MDVTLKLIVVLTYHFNVDLCQSYSEPTNWRNTRKSETPVKSLQHHKPFQHPDMYDEHLKYIADLIQHSALREAQQWQAAVDIQPRSKDRLSEEIQVGNSRLKTKRNQPRQTKATPVVENKHPRKSKHSKKFETRRQAQKNILLKKISAEKETTQKPRKEFAFLYNGNLKERGILRNGYEDNDRDMSETPDDTSFIVGTHNATDMVNDNESHDKTTTNKTNVEFIGNIGNKDDLKKSEKKVNIQYALNLELNQLLGDFIRKKIAQFKDKVEVLRSAGIPI